MHPDIMQVSLVHPGAKVPARATAGSAGYDLSCVDRVYVPAGDTLLVRTGVAVAVPPGTYGRVAPRSGLAAVGIDVLGGVIDADYRGEIVVILHNHGRGSFEAPTGSRIAQLVLERCETPHVVVVNPGRAYTDGRGTGGFGSTGI